jgi:hypothetical protein
MQYNEIPQSIEWETYESIHIDRTPDWFWGVGLTALTLAVIGVLMENILFSILIILAAFALTLKALKVPELHHYAVTKKGVIEGNSLYLYSELKSFWISDDEYFPQLLLRSRRAYMTTIVIPLGDTDPETVHDYLIRFLDVERIEEPSSQKILEYLGF